MAMLRHLHQNDSSTNELLLLNHTITTKAPCNGYALGDCIHNNSDDDLPRAPWALPVAICCLPLLVRILLCITLRDNVRHQEQYRQHRHQHQDDEGSNNKGPISRETIEEQLRTFEWIGTMNDDITPPTTVICSSLQEEFGSSTHRLDGQQQQQFLQPRHQSPPLLAIPEEEEEDEENHIDDDDDDSENGRVFHLKAGCAICWNQFEPYQLVCYSPACRHLFHATCMTDWLLASKYTDCPICRRPWV